jgi:hypothetical protein
MKSRSLDHIQPSEAWCGEQIIDIICLIQGTNDRSLADPHRMRLCTYDWPRLRFVGNRGANLRRFDVISGIAVDCAT